MASDENSGISNEDSGIEAEDAQLILPTDHPLFTLDETLAANTVTQKRLPGLMDIVKAAALVLVPQLVLGIIIGFIAATMNAGWQVGQIPGWLLTPSAIMANALMVVASWYYGCRRYGRSLGEGLAVRPVRRKQIVLAVVAGFGFMLVSVVVSSVAIMGGDEKLANAPMTRMVYSDAVRGVIVMALLAPPAEELFFRGFLYEILVRRWGSLPGILATTLAFTLPHASQLGNSVFGLGCIAGLGLLLTLQRHFTGSIWPSIVTHWVYNALLVGLTLLSLMAMAPPEAVVRPELPVGDEMKQDLVGHVIRDPHVLSGLPWRIDSLEEFREFAVEKEWSEDSEYRRRIHMTLGPADPSAPAEVDATVELTYAKNRDGYRLTRMKLLEMKGD